MKLDKKPPAGPEGEGERECAPFAVEREKFRAECEAIGYPIVRGETEELLAGLIGAKSPARILEIGTCVGYSGCVMLSACSGRLTTVEISEEHVSEAKARFARYGLSDRVFSILGDCADVVPKLGGSFDFIFLDGPKGQYVNLYPYLKDLLADGGILVADNIDFHGIVQEGAVVAHRDRTAQNNLRRFWETLSSDSDFETRRFAAGDGVTVSTKRKTDKDEV